MTTSTDPVAITQRLYDALNGRDPSAIMAVLDPNFVGAVSEGMPVGGGRHEGAEAMLRDCWGTVFTRFDVGLETDELLVVDQQRVVVTGRYLGSERSTGRPVDAVFAHVLRLHGGRISELRQYTDTARWGVS